MKSIKEIIADKKLGTTKVAGWVKTHRQSKNVAFVELNDGSTLKGLQLVIDSTLPSYTSCAEKIFTGCSITATGELVASPGREQPVELKVSEITLIGECDPTAYPLQKKGHTLEFLREHLHLRPRSNTIAAMTRVSSQASFAIHSFFYSRGFYHVHTPIITASDCEGAGQMFRVTTEPRGIAAAADRSKELFAGDAFLTVSGQLEGEMFASALGKIYTFGPTFRAENSNTTRHLAEFWMIEPEMAFYELPDNMRLAEEFVKEVLQSVLTNCPDEIKFFEQHYKPELIKTLEKIVTSNFAALDYTDAIRILEQSGQSFEYPVKWGIDLQSEHERYLCETHVNGPLFIINYPKEIKSFYMKQNADGKTVRAMDLLVPGIGEIIGGSEREEDKGKLEARLTELGMNLANYWWYMDLRRFGTVPHSGFGLGFERLVQYITGMGNIRDCIPVPRYPGFCGF